MVPAPMLPVEVVILLERIAMKDASPISRVFAGLCVAYVTGVKRWFDVQRVSRLERAQDCVLFTSWRSKGKKVSYTWCVPAIGVFRVQVDGGLAGRPRAYEMPRPGLFGPPSVLRFLENFGGTGPVGGRLQAYGYVASRPLMRCASACIA